MDDAVREIMRAIAGPGVPAGPAYGALGRLRARLEAAEAVVEWARVLEGVRSGTYTISRPQFEVEGEAWERLSAAVQRGYGAQREGQDNGHD